MPSASTPSGPDGNAPAARDGLSSAEAARRLAAEGPNELPFRREAGPGRYLLEVLREPLILLLLVAGILYLFLGEPRDAILLLVSLGVIVVIEFYQGYRSERALHALRALGQPQVIVRRDGRRRTIPARELVRGDRLELHEGDRVPADAVVRAASDLLVDESLLTGESLPVRKSVLPEGPPGPDRPGGEDRPIVYSHTLVIRGEGTAEVWRTGPRMEVSRIAAALGEIEREAPVLHRQVRSLVLAFTSLAIVLSVAVALLIALRSGAWVAGLLAGIALTITLLPEEIPVVLTIYTALGARRMAARRALARRLAAIPTLGAITVLCADKTGTLTRNEMSVFAVRTAPDRGTERPDPGDPTHCRLLRVAAEASSAAPVDPMERALRESADRIAPAGAGEAERPILRLYPLRSGRLAVTYVRGGPGEALTVAMKGAPEAVFALAHTPPDERRGWSEAIADLGRQGTRVIAVAHAVRAAADPEVLPEDPGELGARLLGLVALADPLRPAVPGAVAECRAAGVRVLMITGDHPATARAVARAAGIDRPDEVLTGEELRRDPAATARTVGEVNVYARVTPEEKLRLVEALKARGEIVAMTGDGVNDAPALRAAHIGIAMGQRGTDVAREAAALVLLDDAFPTIVEAIRVGRRIYANIRKALGYLVAVHLAIAGMALLPVLLGLPVLLYPVEIVFLEFLIDPISSLSFEAEPEEGDVMATPPRDPEAPLFTTGALALRLLQGGAALAAALAVYLLALGAGLGTPESRALAFTALMTGNLLLVLVSRAETRALPGSLRVPNPVLAVVGALAVALLLLAVYAPPVAQIFQFAPPPAGAMLAAIGASLAGTVWIEPMKRGLLARLHRGDHVGRPG